MNTIIDILILVIGLFIGFIIKSYLPSYFKEKAKNLATKEDIAKITRLQEKVKSDFQLSLEEQKSELNKNLEGLKHQQNRLLKDYELYTVKRFEYYPELNKQLQKSISKAIRLRRNVVKTISDYENYNSEDISVVMTEETFIETDKKRILENWDNNRTQAIYDMNYNLRKIAYNEAYELYLNASDCYQSYSLFLSEDIISITRDLLDTIHHLLYKYDLSPTDKSNLDEEHNKFIEELIKKGYNLRIKLFNKMKDELTVNNNFQATSS